MLAKQHVDSIAIINASKNIIEGTYNTVDNDWISLAANLSRAHASHLITEDLILLGPLGLGLAVLNFIVDAIYYYHYRNTWDAYLRREIDRFEKKIQPWLEKNKNTPNFKTLYKEQLNNIALSLANYKAHTQKLRIQFEEESYEQALLELGKVEKKIAELEKYFSTGLGIPLPECTQNIETTEPKITSSAAKPNPDLEQLNKRQKELKDSLEKEGLTRFSSSSWFQVPFYYAWGYWFVFFFTLWAVATPPLVVPLLISGLAFICPVLYLIYKEAIAYKEKLAGQEPDLSFRWGWLFLAVLAGLTVNFSYLNLAEIGIPLGIGMGIAVLIAAGSMFLIVDALAEKNQNNAKEKNKKEVETTQQLAFERETYQKEMLLRRREIERAIALEEWKSKFQYKNDTPPPSSKATLPPPPANSIFVDILNFVTGYEKKKNPLLDKHTTTTEKIRGLLVVILEFGMGYMLGCMIGFVALDFLGHVPALVSFTDSFLAHLLTGVFSVFTATSSARRAWLSEQAHLTDLDIKRLKANGYLDKESEIDALNLQNANLRKDIHQDISKITDENLKSKAKELEALLDIDKDFKITGLKVLKFVRNALYVITSISTVVFVSRAFIVMGFSKACFPTIVPGILPGSLNLFGPGAISPIGVFVLALAALFLVLRLANKFHMSIQQAEELEKIDSVDRRLEEAKIENTHILQIKATIKTVLDKGEIDEVATDEVANATKVKGTKAANVPKHTIPTSTTSTSPLIQSNPFPRPTRSQSSPPPPRSNSFLEEGNDNRSDLGRSRSVTIIPPLDTTSNTVS